MDISMIFRSTWRYFMGYLMISRYLRYLHKLIYVVGWVLKNMFVRIYGAASGIITERNGKVLVEGAVKQWNPMGELVIFVFAT